MRRLIGLLVNDASLLGHHGSALVSAQARRLGMDAGLDLQSGYDWDSVERLLQGSKNFDVVVVNGEGSIHHDSKTARRISQLAKTLSKRGVPAYLINASEESNSADIHAGLATFRSIYVRDSSSQSSLLRVGVPSTVVPDLTLSWKEAPRANGENLCLVTDAADEVQARRLFEYARRTGLLSITLRTAPPWPVEGSIRRRMAFEGKRLLGRALPASPWNLRYAGAIRDFGDFVSHLGRSSGLVCGRFHAVCLAIRMRLPFRALATPTGKVGALLADVGLHDRLLDAAELENAKRPLEVAPFTRAELDKIASFLQKVDADSQRMFVEIVHSAKATLGAHPD